MYDCETLKKLLYPYLDDELDIKESLRVQVHLEECGRCRRMFESEKRFLEVYRTRMRVQAAPPGLKGNIQHLLSLAGAAGGPSSVGSVRGWPLASVPWLATVVGLLLVVFGSVVLYQILSSQPREAAANLVKVAIANHDGVMKGRIPLDVKGQESSEIIAWLQRGLDFKVVIPPEEFPAMRLVGASLVNLSQDRRAAFLNYESHGDRVSLLMTQPTRVAVQGQKAISFEHIDFYPARYKGYYALSWTDAQLSYVLVSEYRERISEACRICHMADTQYDFTQIDKRI